jgi:hypothetical protein
LLASVFGKVSLPLLNERLTYVAVDVAVLEGDTLARSHAAGGSDEHHRS